MNPNDSWNLNPMASYPLYEQPNSVLKELERPPLTMTSLAIHMLQGDALRRTIFQTRQCPFEESDDTI